MKVTAQFSLVVCAVAMTLTGALVGRVSTGGAFRHRRVWRIGSSSENDDGGNRPPIIPFDGTSFQRPDVVPPPQKVDPPSPPPPPPQKPPVELRSSSQTQFVEDPSRPTGYNNKDDDEDDSWIPSNDSTGVEKFMKDYILDNPYDNPKRRDAKLVVRNVFLFSFAIGAIFTTLFYAFPGKFIERRSDVDFSKRYQSNFVDPNGLLNDEFKNSGGEFFDDAVPPGNPNDATPRIPYEEKTERRAPGRSVTL
jgi:hypothetical protein